MPPMETKTHRWMRHARIWKRLASMHMATSITSRIEFVSYVTAKLIRLGFFFVFALTLCNGQSTVAGYAQGEVLLFFAVMTIIDLSLQLFFRGLMAFPQIIRNGDFDAALSKPVNAFFWAACRMFDLMDFITVPAALWMLWYAIHLLPYTPALSAILTSIGLLICGLLIGFSMNVVTAAVCFWTLSIENAYWLYRDLAYVSRFPPEIYPRSIQFIFTIALPFIVIVSFPAKALMGQIAPLWILGAIIITLIWIAFAAWIWQRGLKHYTSASS